MADGIEVTGVAETRRKMEQVARDLYGAPMVMAFQRSALLVMRDAMINSPVDTGRLRSSITAAIEADETTLQGVVGSNVEYAPFQEFGTKFMPGVFYLQNAFIANVQAITETIENAVEGIVNK